MEYLCNSRKYGGTFRSNSKFEEFSLPEDLSSLLFEDGFPPGDLESGWPFKDCFDALSSSPSLHCSTSTSSSGSNFFSTGDVERGEPGGMFICTCDWFGGVKICFGGGDVDLDRICDGGNGGIPWLERAWGRCSWVDCCCDDCNDATPPTAAALEEFGERSLERRSKGKESHIKFIQKILRISLRKVAALFNP